MQGLLFTEVALLRGKVQEIELDLHSYELLSSKGPDDPLVAAILTSKSKRFSLIFSTFQYPYYDVHLSCTVCK